ncbi:MAG: DUF3303 family protein [Thermoleophilaceae bacterium]
MRVIVIYRPRTTPPPEAMAGMFEGVRVWLENHRSKFEQVDFFVGGGGYGVGDFDGSEELMQIAAEHPFTPFSDVEVRPVVGADEALRMLQEALATSTQ